MRLRGARSGSLTPLERWNATYVEVTATFLPSFQSRTVYRDVKKYGIHVNLHVVDIRDRARVGSNTNLHVVAYCEIVFSATHRAGNVECIVQSLGSDRPS